MKLLLLWCFKEYTQYPLKTIVTFIGLILSMSLYSVVSLYTNLLSYQQETSFYNKDYPYQLRNSEGVLSKQQLIFLTQKNYLKTLRPLSERIDKFYIVDGKASNEQIKYRDQIVKVIALDLLDFQAYMSQFYKHKSYTKNPFDLNQAYYISSESFLSPSLRLTRLLNNNSFNVTTVQTNKKTSPRIIMDTALFYKVYPFINGIDALSLTKSEYKQISQSNINSFFPSLYTISESSELKKRSKWTSSLKYNLKFLALIALMVGGGLLLQFFRFMAYQRLKQANALFHLGVSKKIFSRTLLLESFMIACLITVISLGVGYLIAYMGLSLFNQTISTFYLQFDAQKLYLTGSIIVRIALVTLVSALAAYLSMTKKLFNKEIRIPTIPFTSMGIVSVLAAFLIIHVIVSEFLLFLMGGLIIVSWGLVSLGCMINVIPLLNRLEHASLILFKMAHTSLKKDVISYSLISFVIGLSLSLVVCMGLFVQSFKTTVHTWLNNVMTHDIYMQHTANDIQYPVAIPEHVVAYIEKNIPSKNRYAITRIPFQWRGIPSQIHVVDEHDKNELIIKSSVQVNSKQIAVSVSEPFANKHQLKLGDSINIEGVLPYGVTISSIYYDYISEFGNIKLKRADANGLLLKAYLHGIALHNIQDIDTDHLSEVIQFLNKEPALKLQYNQEIKQQSLDIFNETFIFTWFIVLLISIIALICIINIITIICLDRKKEIYQLWIIGLNRYKIFKMIASQLFIIMIIGLFIAILLGLCLYYFLVEGIQKPMFNWSIFMDVPWLFLGSSIILFLLLSFLSAYLLIRHNSSLRQSGGFYE